MRISALYKRAREVTLSEADILPLSEAVPQRTADFLERIRASRPEFGAPYDVFRIDKVSLVIVDVAANTLVPALSVERVCHSG